MKPAGFPQVAPHERVDVILRRVDAEWCDPLELRAGSRLGVAGLTEAVRRGRVRLVNGLGAGVLENPGLMPYMPAICERLLGEQLRLPSVPTHWCGDEDGRREVLTALAEDPIDHHPSHRRLRRRSRGARPRHLRALILAEPHRFVGQERLPLSQAPAWGDAGRASGRANPSQIVLRGFTVRDGSIYRPLVGGLATLVNDRKAAPSTKDVWVLKAPPATPIRASSRCPADARPGRARALAARRRGPLLVGPVHRARRRPGAPGHHSQRARRAARLRLHDPGRAALRALLGALQRLCGTRWLDPDLEQRSLLLDADAPGRPRTRSERLRDALEGVRDQLSRDTWRAFGSTDRAMKALRASRRPQIAESARRMLGGILSLQGVTANMMRDDGWHAIEAGRLPRARAAGVHAAGGDRDRLAGVGVDRAVLGGVLMAAESSVTHRRRFRGSVRVADVLELLLTDPDNPRSIAFWLARVREHLVEAGRFHRIDPTGAAAGAPRGSASTPSTSRRCSRRGRRPSPSPRGVPRRDACALYRLGDAIVHLHFAAGPEPQPIRRFARPRHGGDAREVSGLAPHRLLVRRRRHRAASAWRIAGRASCRWQHVAAPELSIDPVPGDFTDDTDCYGNIVTYFQVTEPHMRLTIDAVSEVEVVPTIYDEDALLGAVGARAPAGEPGISRGAGRRREFALASPKARHGDAAREYAALSLTPGAPDRRGRHRPHAPHQDRLRLRQDRDHGHHAPSTT